MQISELTGVDYANCSMTWFCKQISKPIPDGSGKNLIQKAVDESEHFQGPQNPFFNMRDEGLIGQEFEYIVEKLLRLYAVYYAPGAEVGWRNCEISHQGSVHVLCPVL